MEASSRLESGTWMPQGISVVCFVTSSVLSVPLMNSRTSLSRSLYVLTSTGSPLTHSV